MTDEPPFRQVVKGSRFVNQTLNLDGIRYEDCEFIGCTLVYSGGEAEVSSCRIHAGTVWQLQECAARTVQVLEQYGWRIEYGAGPESEAIRFPSDAM